MRKKKNKKLHKIWKARTKWAMFGLAIGVVLATVGSVGALNGWFGGASVLKDTITRGLVGYWSFDEGSGSLAYDVSGYANNGTTTNGPLWTKGKVGGALEFDGIDDYVDVRDSSSLDITDAITIEAWAKDPPIGNPNPEPQNGGKATIGFNPTGTHIKNGYLRIRLDVYPDQSSPLYATHYVDKFDREPTKEEMDDPGKLALISTHKELNPFLSHFITISEDTTRRELENYIRDIFGGGTIATLENVLPKSNSIHYVSPLMRGKSNFSAKQIITGDGADLISSINQRFTNLAVSLEGGGEAYFVEPQSIDMGGAAVNRDTSGVALYTVVNLGNPANAAGTIDTVQVYANTNMTGFRAGSAFLVSGTTYQARDNDTIGNVTSGSTQTFTGLSFAVQTNDVMEVYFDTGTLDSDSSGADSYRWVSGEYIDPGDSVNFPSSSTGSFSVYGTGTETPTTKKIVSKGQDAYSLGMSADGSILSGYINGIQITASVATPLQWHHYALTYDGSSQKLYIDGALTATSSLQGGVIATNATDLKIGEGFSGPIDEVRIYNRALSAEEIRYHYNKGGPVAQWKFDEGSGTTAYDSTDNNNDGTLYYMSTSTQGGWTTGKYGTALSFDGVDDYVNVSDSSSLDVTNAITISAWVKFNSVATPLGIIDKYWDGVGRSYYLEAYSSSSAGDEIGFGLGTADGSSLVSFRTTDLDLVANTWYHIVATWSKSSQTTMKVYKNGVPSSTTANKTDSIYQNTKSLTIGDDVQGSSGDANFDGLIDDVRIYNYARTPDEIRLDYNAGFAAHFGPKTSCDQDPGSCMTEGLVGYWGMEEGTGGLVYDRSDNNNNGTTTNMTTPWTSGIVPLSGGKRGGSALSFDGSDDYVNVGNVGNVQSVEFWVNDSNATDGILELINNATYISIAVSAITATGFTSPTIYVNGSSTSASLASGWNHVVITTATAVSAASFLIGEANTDYMAGLIDEVRVYNRALSAEEIRYHYNRGGPVAQWKMDEGSGVTAYDSTDNNNDGSIKSSALKLDNTNDYVAFTPIAYGAYTFEFWFKFNVANTYQGILGFNYPGTDHRGIEILGSPNYSLFFYLNESAPTSYVRFDGVPNDTNWHHLVVYFPGGNPTTMENSKLYIDGVAYSITNYSNMASRTWPTLTLGFDNGDYFNGSFDEFRIYNRELSAAEAAEHYKGKFTDESGLVLYVPFKDASGGTAIDYSGQKNNGDLLGYAAAELVAGYGDTQTTGWVIDTSWQAGRQGAALEFGGVNGFFQSDNSVGTSTSSFSKSLWFKSSDGSYSADEYLFTKGDDDPSLHISSAGKVVVMADNATTVTSIKTVTDTAWHHAEITADGSNIKLYLDGALDGSAVYTGSSADAAIAVGAHISRVNFFNGYIDDMRAYNYARSADEVRLDYNAGFAAHFGPKTNCAQDPGSCITEGLMGYWDMEEGTGSLMHDRSGNNNNGTTTTMTTPWTGGVVPLSGGKRGGYALSFDGSDDRVSIANPANLQLSNVTVFAWIKTSNAGGSYRDIVSKQGAYILSLEDNILVTYDWTGPGKTTTGVNLADGSWHFVSLVMQSGISSGSKMYIDGALATTFTYTVSGQTNGVAIGAAYPADGGNVENYAGLIDEVRIYSRALSDAEIRYHYNRGGPVGWWKFDEGEGRMAYDSTENNNDGTLQLAPSGNTSTSSAWTAGQYGSALSFDGVDDYVDIGDTSQTSVKTISFWLKANDITSRKVIDIDGTDQVEIDSSSQITATSFPGTITYYLNGIAGSRTLTADTWYHVAIIDTTGVNASNMDIGRVSTGYFEGLIDDVRIYNYARTPAQIQQDYNAGLSTHFR